MENLLFLSFLIPSVSFFKTTFVAQRKIVLFIDKTLGYMNKEDKVENFF